MNLKTERLDSMGALRFSKLHINCLTSLDHRVLHGKPQAINSPRRYYQKLVELVCRYYIRISGCYITFRYLSLANQMATFDTYTGRKE